jgi:hypothetical protein
MAVPGGFSSPLGDLEEQRPRAHGQEVPGGYHADRTPALHDREVPHVVLDHDR